MKQTESHITGLNANLPTVLISSCQKMAAFFMSKPKDASLSVTGRSICLSKNNAQTSKYVSCSAIKTASSTKARRRATHSGAKSMALCMRTKPSPMTGYNSKETTAMSQNQKILSHLRDVGSISWVEANDLYRVRSLPRRIKDLRDEGHSIVSEWRTDKLGQRYTRYLMA